MTHPYILRLKPFSAVLLIKLSEYAMGRTINYSDAEVIHRLLKASKNNNYQLRDLIVSIVADESFTKR